MYKMKKVLLLNPPGSKLYIRDAYSSLTSKANYYWPPVDLIVQSGILGEQYDIEVLDAIALKLSPSEAFQKIVHYEPEAVFFVTGSVSWPEDSVFLKKIKEVLNPIMIGSGNILQFASEKIMHDSPFVDAILCDITSDSIVKYLEGNNGRIENLLYKKDTTIVEGERTKATGTFAVPIPKHELFPLDRYALPFFRRRGPFTISFASFGCPYTCVYCYAGSFGFKLRDTENTISELKYIQSLSIKKVRFRDSSFTHDGDHALRLCLRMKDENLDFEWYCESRPDTLGEPLVRAMKEAGCSMITFGIESADKELLSRYRDTLPSTEDIKRSFSLCKKYKIRTGAHIMIGLPGDDEQKILDTLNFLIEIDCDFAGFNIANPRLGTKLRDISIKNRWIHEDLQEADSSGAFPVIETEKLTRERLWQLHHQLMKRFYFRPYYLYKILKDIKSFEDLKMYSQNGLSILGHLLQWQKYSS